MVQWMIDQAIEVIEKKMKGMIVMWHGLIADIPDGWALCDGTQGTPFLKGTFVRGALHQSDMGSDGGSNNHQHTFTSDTHYHGSRSGEEFQQGENFDDITDARVVTGTSDPADSRPPYYSLAFIMKL